MAQILVEEEEEEIYRPLSTRLVGEVTLGDYKDLRDLRLLLWNLRRELCERYGISRACEAADELVPLIEAKIDEIREKMKKSQ